MRIKSSCFFIQAHPPAHFNKFARLPEPLSLASPTQRGPSNHLPATAVTGNESTAYFLCFSLTHFSPQIFFSLTRRLPKVPLANSLPKREMFGSASPRYLAFFKESTGKELQTSLKVKKFDKKPLWLGRDASVRPKPINLPPLG